MNVNMYENPVIQKNINKLQEYGVEFVEPDSGELACGWEGKGRLAEPEKIFNFIKKKDQNKDLAEENILIPKSWLTVKKCKNNRCLAGVLPPANTKRTDQDPARRRHE